MGRKTLRPSNPKNNKCAVKGTARKRNRRGRLGTGQKNLSKELTRLPGEGKGLGGLTKGTRPLEDLLVEGGEAVAESGKPEEKRHRIGASKGRRREDVKEVFG